MKRFVKAVILLFWVCIVSKSVKAEISIEETGIEYEGESCFLGKSDIVSSEGVLYSINKDKIGSVNIKGSSESGFQIVESGHYYFLSPIGKALLKSDFILFGSNRWIVTFDSVGTVSNKGDLYRIDTNNFHVFYIDGNGVDDFILKDFGTWDCVDALFFNGNSMFLLQGEYIKVYNIAGDELQYKGKVVSWIDDLISDIRKDGYLIFMGNYVNDYLKMSWDNYLINEGEDVRISGIGNKFSKAYLYNDYAEIELGNKAGVISYKGDVLVPPKYDVVWKNDYSGSVWGDRGRIDVDGYFMVSKGNSFAFIKQGKEIISGYVNKLNKCGGVSLVSVKDDYSFLVAADGNVVKINNYYSLEPLSNSNGYLLGCKVNGVDNYVNIVDWHGKKLLDDGDYVVSVSGSGNYILINGVLYNIDYNAKSQENESIIDEDNTLDYVTLLNGLEKYKIFYNNAICSPINNDSNNLLFKVNNTTDEYSAIITYIDDMGISELFEKRATEAMLKYYNSTHFQGVYTISNGIDVRFMIVLAPEVRKSIYFGVEYNGGIIYGEVHCYNKAVDDGYLQYIAHGMFEGFE